MSLGFGISNLGFGVIGTSINTLKCNYHKEQSMLLPTYYFTGQWRTKVSV